DIVITDDVKMYDLGAWQLEGANINLIENSKINLITDSTNYVAIRTVSIESGKTYTLSVKGNAGLSATLEIKYSYGSVVGTFEFATEFDELKSFTFTSNYTGLLTIKSRVLSGSGDVYIDWYKLEFGSVSTDWRPTPLEVCDTNAKRIKCETNSFEISNNNRDVTLFLNTKKYDTI
ncbi:MAG TPA: hypothetical protein DCS17_02815, partial [Flavobacterium sp.]|nr:hypothetical protein [Flavobacterium sp.]